MWYKNIAGRFFGLVTNACDGRTDGQNYDFQDRASIAASRGKNGSPYAIGPLIIITRHRASTSMYGLYTC